MIVTGSHRDNLPHVGEHAHGARRVLRAHVRRRPQKARVVGGVSTPGNSSGS